MVHCTMQYTIPIREHAALWCIMQYTHYYDADADATLLHDGPLHHAVLLHCTIPYYAAWQRNIGYIQYGEWHRTRGAALYHRTIRVTNTLYICIPLYSPLTGVMHCTLHVVHMDTIQWNTMVSPSLHHVPWYLVVYLFLYRGRDYGVD